MANCFSKMMPKCFRILWSSFWEISGFWTTSFVSLGFPMVGSGPFMLLRPIDTHLRERGRAPEWHPRGIRDGQSQTRNTGKPATATPTPGMPTLDQNIRLLKLDVAQHVPIHGRVATNDEFLKIIGNVPALISLE
jgi:hypothetical protein